MQYNIAPVQYFNTSTTTNITVSEVAFALGLAKLSMYLDHKIRCNCRLNTTANMTQCIGDYSTYDIMQIDVICYTCLGAVEYFKALRLLDNTKTCLTAMDSVCSPFLGGLHSVGLACRLFSAKLCSIPMIESIVDIQSETDVCIGQLFCPP